MGLTRAVTSIRREADSSSCRLERFSFRYGECGEVWHPQTGGRDATGLFNDLRQLVVAACEAGDRTRREISEQFQICEGTLYEWLQR